MAIDIVIKIDGDEYYMENESITINHKDDVVYVFDVGRVTTDIVDGFIGAGEVDWDDIDESICTVLEKLRGDLEEAVDEMCSDKGVMVNDR